MCNQWWLVRSFNYYFILVRIVRQLARAIVRASSQSTCFCAKQCVHMHYYLARALCKCTYEYNLILKWLCPCAGTISMEPHRVDVSWKTTKVQKREEEGRKEEERKRRKISISSPVPVLSNHSSSSSAWPKPIQFQFRFSETNPVSFGQLGIKSSFSWGKENQSNTNPFHGAKKPDLYCSKCKQ